MKCQVLVDWLTFSVKEQDPAKVIREYLGLDPELFQDAGYGLLGYNRVLRFSDICVCYEPRENDFFRDMGVCVSMSGNGCRAFETMSKLTQAGQDSVFPTLFQLLAADETANVSRIDIACDDRKGFLNMEEIVEKVQANEINSRMTKRSVIVSFDGTQRSGSTIYLGAPSSDFRVRIYDKALEEGVDGHWIRVELVMRHKNAAAFVAQMNSAPSVGKLAAQVVNDKFSFIERDDSNITRCTVCGWWQSFVDELESVRLVARCVIQHSVERIENWIESQVGPSLAVILNTLGWPHLFELARAAAGRLSAWQLSLISDYNSLQTARLQAAVS
jgi:DNA relaxase NicK